MNLKNPMGPATKWQRGSLKSSWYDDHVGYDASPRDVAENRVRNFQARFLPRDEEGAGSDVERFFDLFEPRGG